MVEAFEISFSVCLFCFSKTGLLCIALAGFKTHRNPPAFCLFVGATEMHHHHPASKATYKQKHQTGGLLSTSSNKATPPNPSKQFTNWRPSRQAHESTVPFSSQLPHAPQAAVRYSATVTYMSCNIFKVLKIQQ